MTRRSRAAGAAGMVALVAVGALAGCGAGSAGDGESADGSVVREDAAEPAAGAAAAPGEADPADGGEAARALVDARHVIYTGSISVRVPDVAEAARAATALAQRYGGFVGADRRSATEDAPAEATLVLRIPSDQFTAAVTDLGELGEETAREIDTEDVTEEVVDLETRIATAEASVVRTRTLLERAESIQDIVDVEEELAEREARLASLQARQRELADLTALSTITARLRGTTAPAAAEDASDTGFLAGLAAGWRGFTASAAVALTVLGVLLPWLLALGAPAAAAGWWFRRRRAMPPAV